MNTDLMLLSRYLDDELDSQEMQVLDGRLEKEPELNALLALMREQNNRFINEVSKIDNIPLSAPLAALLATDDDAKAPSINNRFSDIIQSLKSYFSWRQGLTWAMACSFMFALFFVVKFSAVGFTISDETLVQGNNTPPKLAAFLSHQLTGSSESLKNGNVFQKMAFMDDSGHLCKYYTAENAQDLYHVVACNENAQWKNQFVLKDEKQLASSNEDWFMPAKDELNKAVEKYLAEKIPNTPLTKDEEALRLKQLR